MLPRTSLELLDPNAVPYFLRDDHTTVAEAKAILAGSDAPARDELVV
jgi:hypothetical protein